MAKYFKMGFLEDVTPNLKEIMSKMWSGSFKLFKARDFETNINHSNEIDILSYNDVQEFLERK